MYRLVVLVVAVACVAGVSAVEADWQMEGLDFVDENTEDEVAAERPHPRHRCCLPATFEATEAAVTGYTHNGTAGLVGTFFPRLAIDFRRGKFAAVEFVFTKGKKFNVTLIGDQKAGKLYLIHYEKKTCKAIKMHNMSSPCLPKSAKFMGFRRFGVGRHSLIGENWFVHGKSKNASVAVLMTLQAETCVPIHEEVVAHAHGVRAMTSVTFSGIRLKIRNPRIFNVPKFCKGAEVVENPIMSAYMNAMHARYTGL